jgi:hypothetical protein
MYRQMKHIKSNIFLYCTLNYQQLYDPDARISTLYFSISVWVLIIAFIYKNVFKKTPAKYTGSYNQVI